MKDKRLEDDGYCFACGQKNLQGLSLQFSITDGKASAEFILQKIHQGYKDIVHGGIISTILDESMIKAVLAEGINALTAEITVRFRNPLMVGEMAVVEAEITKIGSRLIETAARIKKIDSTIIAEAHAKLLRHESMDRIQ